MQADKNDVQIVQEREPLDDRLKRFFEKYSDENPHMINAFLEAHTNYWATKKEGYSLHEALDNYEKDENFAKEFPKWKDCFIFMV